jgi:hypothetical protein
MSSINAREWIENAENAFTLTFLEQYHKDGDETYFSFVNV